MKGGSCKRRRRREPSQPPKETTTSSSASFPVSESACSDSGLKPSECTPKRCRQIKETDELCKTSTPVQAKSPKVLFRIPSPSSENVQKTESEDNKLKPSSRRRSPKPRQIIKKQKKTCIKSNGINIKRRGAKKRKTEEANLSQESEPSQRCRPRLNLEKSAAGEQDDSVPSSDLSIELSVHEEPLPHLSFQEDEENDQEEEEEEELPSFLMVDTRPPSITKGGFVWYKSRNFPFWPAMVKSVNHKMKRASIMFVDDKLIQKKRGFRVALKTLKPFDCEEAKELVCKAKEKYDVAIEWSVELIKDYTLRKGCGSFSGSFIEYYAHDMSYPVRRKYQAISERLTIASDAIMEESLLTDNLSEDSFSEQQDIKSYKRLLPDRTHAAHNRANEKLVNFIVKQRMVEQHLLAVMCGQQQSRWLRSFLSANRRRIVNIYLEDDKQLDQVYWYLNELYTTAVETDTCLVNVKSVDHVPFVLDVLLPEAIIYAIAGVDNISIKKAEEKYLKGRCISKREREEFDFMIEQQMKTKSFTPTVVRYSETAT